MTDIAQPSQFRNLWKRSVTAIVLIGIALAALLIGRWSLWLLTGILAIVMVGEWAHLMGVGRWRTALAAVAMLCFLLFIHPSFRPIDEMSLAALAVAAAVATVISLSFRLGIGILYIGMATLALLHLRASVGWQITLWTLAIVWATDISAYFAGKLIGGPKLAPKYSPNKTWAGLIGGIAGATIVGGAIAIGFDLPRWLIPLGGLFAIVAQGGDLYESWLKRRAGVKDASGIFPGHGGALDRLDGMMPVAIVMAGITAAGLI